MPIKYMRDGKGGVMFKRLLVIIPCVLLFACSAFDNSDQTLPVGPDGEFSIGADGGGEYEGVYSGTVTLVSNECVGAGAEIAMPTEMTADVLQSGNIISIQFGAEAVVEDEVVAEDAEDEVVADDNSTEITGTLVDNAVTLVYKELNISKIYRLNFSEDGITGTCEIAESTVSGELGATCATYDIELNPAS